MEYLNPILFIEPTPSPFITHVHTHTARTYDIALAVCTEGLSINKESKKLMVEFHLRRARVHKLIAKSHITKAAAASSSSSSSSSGENRIEEKRGEVKCREEKRKEKIRDEKRREEKKREEKRRHDTQCFSFDWFLIRSTSFLCFVLHEFFFNIINYLSSLTLFLPLLLLFLFQNRKEWQRQHRERYSDVIRRPQRPCCCELEEVPSRLHQVRYTLPSSLPLHTHTRRHTHIHSTHAFLRTIPFFIFSPPFPSYT